MYLRMKLSTAGFSPTPTHHPPYRRDSPAAASMTSSWLRRCWDKACLRTFRCGRRRRRNGLRCWLGAVLMKGCATGIEVCAIVSTTQRAREDAPPRIELADGVQDPVVWSEFLPRWQGRTGPVVWSEQLNRPGFDGGSQSPEDESHGCTEEVPG